MRDILKTNVAMSSRQRQLMEREESRMKASRLNWANAAHAHGPIKLGDFRMRKRRRFASSFSCFILFRLRMLLGFRSLIPNNDELRRIKKEFFQKGRFICREPMPGLMRMHASRLLCGCAHVCSFSPGCAQTFPLMRSQRVTTRFICEIVFSSIPTIVVSFPILTLRRWFRGRRFYLAGSGHVRL